MAQTINDVAYDVEDKRTQLESEEIVADLVHSFLLPEAQKRSVREKVQRQQRKHLQAAHTEIYKLGEEVIDMFPRPQTAPQSSPPKTQESQAPPADASYQQVFGKVSPPPPGKKTSPVTSAKASPVNSQPPSRKGSATGDEGKGSRVGSPGDKGSLKGSPAGSRRGSGSNKGSRPGSAASQK